MDVNNRLQHSRVWKIVKTLPELYKGHNQSKSNVKLMTKVHLRNHLLVEIFTSLQNRVTFYDRTT